MASVTSLNEQRSPFISAPPSVRLVHAMRQPFNNAVATARTCYSSRVITEADVDRDDKSRAQRDTIARSTYEAGHHTTLQHASFQFVLENVSRQCIWSFLHAHLFYNSEQVSQRYVEVKPDRVVIPHLAAKAQLLYQETLEQQMACYRRLVELLTPPAAKEYFAIFPARQKHQDDHRGALKKKAQEIARYALPIGTFAHMYHTVSGITLHRYHRLMQMFDVPTETRFVVEAMIREVENHDPLFFSSIEDPLTLEETLEFQALASLSSKISAHEAVDFCRDFDAELGELSSRLVSYAPNAEVLLAQSVRSTLGVGRAVVSDDAAIERVLSPAANPYLAGALNLNTFGKLTRTMAHVHYTFQKKISHTADSQDQRHRTVPGSRPVLFTHYRGGEPDVIIPELLKHSAQALDLFEKTMQHTFANIDRLLDDGVPHEYALYLLPNAFPVRFYESGDLLGLHHKWTTRLCYNAQEEIWRASKEEVAQVKKVHPRIGQHIEAPCGLRREAKMRPLCPEGPRFCGVPVWKLEVERYQRVL